MMIAAVHVDPVITVPAAVCLAAGIVWYWFRVGRCWKARGRRGVRRASLAFMVISLPALVRGLSYCDPELEPREYMISWSVATLLVLMVLATGCIDGVLTLGTHRRQYRDAVRRVSEEVAEAARKDAEGGEGGSRTAGEDRT